jgi:hypothetical protein
MPTTTDAQSPTIDKFLALADLAGKLPGDIGP